MRRHEDLLGATSAAPGILFPVNAPDPGTASAKSLADLNLDGVIKAIAAPFGDANDLTELFRRPLADVTTVAYRHAVFADLEDASRRDELAAAAREIVTARRQFDHSREIQHRRVSQLHRIEAAVRYVSVVEALASSPRLLEATSSGLHCFVEALEEYRQSEEFRRLSEDANHCGERIAEIEYCVHLSGLTVEVSRYEGEIDFSEQVLATFERFAQVGTASYLVRYRDRQAVDHVQTQIVDCLARLFPHEFEVVEQFDERHRTFLAPLVEAFARDLRFYVAYLEFIAPMRQAGVATCYPQVVAEPVASADDALDVALALDRAATSTLVPNSFELDGNRRVVVVTGPNQGGKTTFARMVGQLLHLASLGCPVTARRARLGLFDGLLTHFEGEEDATDERGRLEADIDAVRGILTSVTSQTVVILNEPFSSTTLVDCRELGRRALSRVIAAGARCVYVTFVDELASMNPAIVSAVSQVDPHDPVRRTFRIVEAPANGRVYAQALARAFGLSYEQLRTGERG